MWHLLNNMWRDPPSTPPVQRQALCSPPINMSTAAKTTTLDDERRTSGAARCVYCTYAVLLSLHCYPVLSTVIL